ncbi:hypothetical protein [Saccharopolyspora rhizosphaerae]|uniref:hypothetical protein n=1 Tax=Saccharopolyspora rhizosphaerae TaxID=2492662 RepID=UPI001F288D63|nr:hypothetical protein [Saccharopolyspora rhizosphaerae]
MVDRPAGLDALGLAALALGKTLLAALRRAEVDEIYSGHTNAVVTGPGALASAVEHDRAGRDRRAEVDEPSVRRPLRPGGRVADEVRPGGGR